MIESQSKTITDLQLKNESLSSRLCEEVANQTEIQQKWEQPKWNGFLGGSAVHLFNVILITVDTRVMHAATGECSFHLFSIMFDHNLHKPRTWDNIGFPVDFYYY